MSKNPIKNNLVIELHVPDFEVVKNFYGALGFEIIMEHVVTENTPGYLVMQRSDELGATMINFYGGNDLVYNQSYFKNFPNTTQCGYGVEVTVPVADLDVFYDSIKDKIKDNILQAITIKHDQEMEWRDIRIADPFGFYLRFTELIDWGQKRSSS